MTKKIRDDADFVLKQVVTAMQDKKAKNIISLDLQKIPNAVTRYFVICDASSNTHIGSIYDNVLKVVKKHCGISPYHREGVENAEWILVDYIDVVVHIFLEETRQFYKLEDLWADAGRKEYDTFE